MKVLLTTLNAKYVHTSLAVHNLAAFCRKDGFDVIVAEYTINQEILAIVSDIYSKRPTVIGIACYIWNVSMVMELASLLKKVMPDTPIILGGPEVTYDPNNIMERFPFIDYIVLGEGEETLSELLTSILYPTTKRNFSGLAMRCNNRVEIFGDAKTVKVLDDLPFAYSVENVDTLRDKILYYESSRGCPFSCQYCLSSATTGVRYYSLERVFSDLQLFIDKDVRQVKFVDRTFNTRKAHCLPIIRFLAKQNCRTNFHFEIAADLLDDEIIDALAKAPVGRFQLEIGIQSTYKPALQAICRNNDWIKITSAISRLRQADTMHLHLDLIIGLPFESLESFAQSFNDVFSLHPHMLQIGFLKLLKGSGVRHSAQQHGYVFMDEAPYEVLANRYLPYDEVRKLKILENVFDQTYNSDRFHVTLSWLIQRFFNGSAFHLFQSLSSFWEEQNLGMTSHSPKAVYEILTIYCQKNFPADRDTAMQLLKFDALHSDRGTVKPDFLPWKYPELDAEISGFWRNEETVRKYISDYQFTSWREVRRNYQIELFAIDIAQFLQTGHIHQQQIVVLFDHRQNKTNWVILPNFLEEDI